MEEMNALLARRWGETHTTQLKLSFCPDQLWLRWLTGHCRVAPPTVPSVYIQTSNVFWLAVIESRWSCTLHITPGLDRVLQFILPSKPHTLYLFHIAGGKQQMRREMEKAKTWGFFWLIEMLMLGCSSCQLMFVVAVNDSNVFQDDPNARGQNAAGTVSIIFVYWTQTQWNLLMTAELRCVWAVLLKEPLTSTESVQCTKGSLD